MYLLLLRGYSPCGLSGAFNAFTPNNDSSNDQFIGKGVLLENLSDFNMRIWNRWGEKVFETSDPFTGWNGTKDNVGALLPRT